MRGTDVSNVVVVVEAVDVAGQFGGDSADGIGSLVGVYVGLVVNSGELAVDACCVIEEVEVLVDSNVAPVGYVDVSGGLGEGRQWVHEGKHQLDLLEGHGLHVLVGAEDKAVI